MTRHSPVSPQSGKLVPQRIVVFFLLWFRQEMKSKQGGEEAKAGLSPDHGVETNQALQGDKELGGGEQVEGGEHQGDRRGERLQLRWEGVVEEVEGQRGEAHGRGDHEEGEGEEREEGGRRARVRCEAVDGEREDGQGGPADHRGEDVQRLAGEVATAGCDQDGAANKLEQGNDDRREMFAAMAACHLEKLDCKEVNGELPGEDHDEDKDADGGKGVHVLSVDCLQAFDQVWGGLAILCLLIKNIRS